MCLINKIENKFLSSLIIVDIGEQWSKGGFETTLSLFYKIFHIN